MSRDIFAMIAALGAPRVVTTPKLDGISVRPNICKPFVRPTRMPDMIGLTGERTSGSDLINLVREL